MGSRDAPVNPAAPAPGPSHQVLAEVPVLKLVVCITRLEDDRLAVAAREVGQGQAVTRREVAGPEYEHEVRISAVRVPAVQAPERAPDQAAARHQFGPLTRSEAMVRVSAQAEVM